MSAALDLDHIPPADISPAPEVLWARPQLASAGLETYRLVRSRLALHPRQPRAVLVTSAAAGDGKSITAVNLAGALALSGSKVLLVDGNLRRPAVHRLLGMEDEPGLARVLSGSHTLQQSCRRIEGYRGLFVLTAGSAGHAAGDLLPTRHWQALHAAIRASFHYAVIDAPTVGSSAEYEWLESVSDGVVFVVRKGGTGRAVCLDGLSRIASGLLLGIVLNEAA